MRDINGLDRKSSAQNSSPALAYSWRRSTGEALAVRMRVVPVLILDRVP